MEDKQERQQRLERDMEAKIAEFGWYAIGTETGEGLPFLYTVGCWKTWQHPELVVVGMHPAISHALVTNIIDEHVRDGKGVTVGPSYPGLLQNDYELCFRQVSQEHIIEHCCWADAYYERAVFPALQVVFQDPEYRYPWQKGYDMVQPLWTIGETVRP